MRVNEETERFYLDNYSAKIGRSIGFEQLYTHYCSSVIHPLPMADFVRGLGEHFNLKADLENRRFENLERKDA